MVASLLFHGSFPPPLPRDHEEEPEPGDFLLLLGEIPLESVALGLQPGELFLGPLDFLGESIPFLLPLFLFLLDASFFFSQALAFCLQVPDGLVDGQ